jgi:hypothetical protein
VERKAGGWCSGEGGTVDKATTCPVEKAAAGRSGGEGEWEVQRRAVAVLGEFFFFLQWREGTDRSGYESLVGIAAHKRDVRVDGCPSGTITVFFLPLLSTPYYKRKFCFSIDVCDPSRVNIAVFG